MPLLMKRQSRVLFPASGKSYVGMLVWVRLTIVKSLGSAHGDWRTKMHLSFHQHFLRNTEMTETIDVERKV